MDHINSNHPSPQALNILQACTSLPNGNTTTAAVSPFLRKTPEDFIFLIYLCDGKRIFSGSNHSNKAIK